MMNPFDDLIDFYAAIQRAHIDAQLAAMTHQRIADDLGRALTILAGSLPGRPDAASPPPSTNASGLPLPAPVLAEPDTPKANNFGQFRDEARDRAQDRGPGKGLAAGNSSDGPWRGGGNGSRDVFDHVHRYPRGRWT